MIDRVLDPPAMLVRSLVDDHRQAGLTLISVGYLVIAAADALVRSWFWALFCTGVALAVPWALQSDVHRAEAAERAGMRADPGFFLRFLQFGCVPSVLHWLLDGAAPHAVGAVGSFVAAVGIQCIFLPPGGRKVKDVIKGWLGGRVAAVGA